jgi:oxygen-independent coproporphyrinogen-3 oxidase
MQRVESKRQAVVETEKPEPKQAAGEFMFMGLRMIQGISIEEFIRRFGKTPDEFYPQISDWLKEGLMEKGNARLRLTRRGLLVSNSIFVSLF